MLGLDNPRVRMDSPPPEVRGDGAPPSRSRCIPFVLEPLDWAVVRAPLLPVEAFPREHPKDSWGDTLLPSNPYTRTAVAIASEHLYAALQRTPVSAPEAPRLRGKLLRYMIRMSTRPTPFGLFAGVGLAEWGPATEIRIAAGAPRTRSRPDMGWLLGLVAELECDPDIRRQLRLFVNQLALIRAGHVRVDDRTAAVDGGFTE